MAKNNIYEIRLRQLKYQVDNMLLEGEESGAVAGMGATDLIAPDAKIGLEILLTQLKLAILDPLDMFKKSIVGPLKVLFQTKSVSQMILTGFKSVKEWSIVTRVINVGTMSKAGILKLAGVATTAPLAFALTVTALVVGGGTLWYRSGTLDRVREATANALANGNLNDMTKHINTLKKISSQGFWNKLVNNEEGRNIAASNIEGIKKGYIGIGIALIIVSLISIAILTSSMDVIRPLTKAVTSFDLKGICQGVTKLLAFGLAVLPAVLGVAMISVARASFQNVEGTMAGKIMIVASPMVSIANKIVLGTLETLNQKHQPAYIAK